jgi:hypothetical protein
MWDNDRWIVAAIMLGVVAAVALAVLLAYLYRRWAERRWFERTGALKQKATEQRIRREAEIAAEKPYLHSTTLLKAIEQRSIGFHISGTGHLSSLHVALTSLVDYPLGITIAKGSIFRSLNPLVQNMMSLETKNIHLSPQDAAQTDINVACVNKYLATPSDVSGFMPVADDFPAFGRTNLPRPVELNRIIECTEFKQGSSLVRQFAVWIVTDDPTRAEIENDLSRSLSSKNDASTADEVHHQAEQVFTQLRVLFNAAGIDVSGYRVFRELLRRI